MAPATSYKIPQSVLVVIYTPALEVRLRTADWHLDWIAL